jgi:chaperonin cofactor prefoldin
MEFLPCILCGKELDQRKDKNGKPYFTCDPCGTQYFIRRQQGIEKLGQLIREVSKREAAIHQRFKSLHEIQAILSEIESLKSEIKKINSLFIDEDGARTRKALKTRVQSLLAQLEKLAKQSE